MGDQQHKSDLAGSTVWAAVVLALGFFGFLAFLINGQHTEELRSVLVLIGQGGVAALNIFFVYRSTLSTNKKVDNVDRRAEQINAVTEEVRETAIRLNGHVLKIVKDTTPQPGSIPRVDPGEGYTPEH
jgi:hypothetical protein